MQQVMMTWACSGDMQIGDAKHGAMIDHHAVSHDDVGDRHQAYKVTVTYGPIPWLLALRGVLLVTLGITTTLIIVISPLIKY
jgi:hypothetical protein